MQSLKKLHPHLKECASGNVSLLSGDIVQPDTKVGSIVKRALQCRTGTFDGMYGEVVVTEEILRGLADRYNSTKANAQNDNDYAPILTDHIREVDRIKGRMLPGLTVEPWVNPETGEQELGLFGLLRIDCADAQKKVDQGQYAHLSISFDEESFELFEISFVAVEAARGSMVLSKNSQGGKMELSKKLASLAAKHKALASEVKLARKSRQASLKAIALKKDDLAKDLVALTKRIESLKTRTKTNQLKARFSEFVQSGKMNPAEVAKIDLTSLAALPVQALEIVLSSYDNRAVSTDVFQYGQAGSAMKSEALTKDAMTEAIKLQKAGKTGVVLADRVEESEVVDPAKKKLEGEEEKPKKSIDAEDMKATLAEMDEIHGKMGEAMGKLKALGEEADKVGDSDKKDEEREMSDGDDGDDMSAADDEKPEDKK